MSKSEIALFYFGVFILFVNKNLLLLIIIRLLFDTNYLIYNLDLIKLYIIFFKLLIFNKLIQLL
jgi:hypothetical protein